MTGMRGKEARGRGGLKKKRRDGEGLRGRRRKECAYAVRRNTCCYFLLVGEDSRVKTKYLNECAEGV